MARRDLLRETDSWLQVLAWSDISGDLWGAFTPITAGAEKLLSQVAACKTGANDPAGAFMSVVIQAPPEIVEKICWDVVSTRQLVAGSTIIRQCLRKSTPMMVNFMSARRRVHKKWQPWKRRSISFSPQQGIRCLPGLVKVMTLWTADRSVKSWKAAPPPCWKRWQWLL